jgi:hypothetical protein
MSRSVWALEDEEVSDFLHQAENPDAKLRLAEIIETISQRKLVRAVVAMWTIWHARRKTIHEEMFQSPLSTHSFITRYIEELEQVKPKNKQEKATQNGHRRWLPPTYGEVKLNVDTALAKSGSFAVATIVARDAIGGASAIVREGLTNPEQVEAIACREGLALAKDLLITRVQVASDCANVIKAIEGAGRL